MKVSFLDDDYDIKELSLQDLAYKAIKHDGFRIEPYVQIHNIEYTANEGWHWCWYSEPDGGDSLYFHSLIDLILELQDFFRDLSR